MKSDDKHSNRVRTLMNEKIPFMLRWGTFLIALLMVGVALWLATVDWPYGAGESVTGHILRFGG